MFQLMAEAFCHFIFSVNYNFLSIFIECLNRDLLRTDCFYKTVRETKASLTIDEHLVRYIIEHEMLGGDTRQ